jgi:hypothetical protein
MNLHVSSSSCRSYGLDRLCTFRRVQNACWTLTEVESPPLVRQKPSSRCLIYAPCSGKTEGAPPVSRALDHSVIGLRQLARGLNGLRGRSGASISQKVRSTSGILLSRRKPMRSRVGELRAPMPANSTQKKCAHILKLEARPHELRCRNISRNSPGARTSWRSHLGNILSESAVQMKGHQRMA